MNEKREQMTPPYGVGDTSYIAAGGEPGLRRLCEEFYRLMHTLPEAKTIRDMHQEDLSVMIDKLTLFLCMWLNGPKLYLQKYSFVGMPRAHQHLMIGDAERDAWLLCMDRAIDAQPYADSFKDYLKKQLRFPAEMIRKTSRANLPAENT